MRVNKCVLACAAAALVLAAAATGSGSGGITACAKTGNGQLRLAGADGCQPSEQEVALGTAAASTADERYYVAANLTDPSTFLSLGNGAGHATAVVTSHVAAGDYAIAAQVTFTGFAGNGDVVCILLDPSGQTHGYAETAYDTAAPTQTMTMDGAVSLTADTDLSLTCWNIVTGGGDAAVRAADITTKSVDRATVEQETH